MINAETSQLLKVYGCFEQLVERKNNNLTSNGIVKRKTNISKLKEIKKQSLIDNLSVVQKKYSL